MWVGDVMGCVVAIVLLPNNSLGRMRSIDF